MRMRERQNKGKMSKGTCPTVLSWGHLPLARINKGKKTVVYPDGLTMSFDLGAKAPFVETLRVTAECSVEHQFSMGDVSSGWYSARADAFRDCVEAANYNLPHERTVIYGPSHAEIQRQVLERFASAASASKTKKKKRVSWGDQHQMVVDGPEDGHKYGGWGLEHFKIIPDRHEMNVLYGFWQTDLELDADLTDFVHRLEPSDCGLLDEEGHSHGSLPLFSSTAFDDDKTVYPPSEEELSDDSEGDDEEVDQSLDDYSPSTKRVKVFDSDCEEDSTSVPGISTKVFEFKEKDEMRCVDSESAEELREADFWLLQNEHIL